MKCQLTSRVSSNSFLVTLHQRFQPSETLTSTTAWCIMYRGSETGAEKPELNSLLKLGRRLAEDSFCGMNANFQCRYLYLGCSGEAAKINKAGFCRLDNMKFCGLPHGVR